MSKLDKQVPVKTKNLVRGNEAPSMTKELRKAIMNRSKFKKWLSRENLLAFK